MKNLLIIAVFVFLGQSVIGANYKRMVKKNYPIVYSAIKEDAIRKWTNDKQKQRTEVVIQSEAFWHIAQEIEQQPNEKRMTAIKSALLRWHWHWDGKILTFPQPVDWRLAWMECGK